MLTQALSLERLDGRYAGAALAAACALSWIGCGSSGNSGGATQCGALAQCCQTIEEAETCQSELRSHQTQPQAEELCAQTLAGYQQEGECESIGGIGGAGGQAGSGVGGLGGESGEGGTSGGGGEGGSGAVSGAGGDGGTGADGGSGGGGSMTCDENSELCYCDDFAGPYPQSTCSGSYSCCLYWPDPGGNSCTCYDYGETQCAETMNVDPDIQRVATCPP